MSLGTAWPVGSAPLCAVERQVLGDRETLLVAGAGRGEPGVRGHHASLLSNLQDHRAPCPKRWPGLLPVPDPGSLSLLYRFLWAFL